MGGFLWAELLASGRSFAWEGSCGVVTGFRGRSFSRAGLQGACLPAKLAWPAWAADSDWMVPGPRIMFYMLNRFHKVYEV